MGKLEGWSVVGYTALGLLCAVWIGYGWFILIEGEFYSRPRYSAVTTHVVGHGVTFMAFVFFSLAAICTATILERLNAPRAAFVVTSTAALGLPILYLVTR